MGDVFGPIEKYRHGVLTCLDMPTAAMLGGVHTFVNISIGKHRLQPLHPLMLQHVVFMKSSSYRQVEDGWIQNHR